MNGKVVWSEGLFLQPQHFQQQERYFEHLIMQRPNVSGYSNWGVSELEIDEQLLLLGKLAIVRCVGILPDGSAFSIPESNSEPVVIDIPSNITNQCIYLGLPLLQAGSSQIGIGEDNQPYLRYRGQSLQVKDINIGSTETTLVIVGRLSFRLMLETDDRGGYSCLPIAKVQQSFADKRVQLDKQFIPTCLDINVVAKFKSFLQELLSLLKHRGDTLMHHITEAGHSSVSEVADFMLLQLINRSEGICEFYAHKKGVHPEIFYSYLIQLVGELATFTNKTRRPNKVPPYCHDDLQSCFDPVIQELRHALSLVLEHGAVSLVLEQHKYGIWVSPLTDRTLLQNAQFVLAAKADLTPDSLRTLFIKQVKVAPVEDIQSLITRALPGINLQPLVVVPRQIPFNVGFVYFALDQSHEYWKQLDTSAGIAIHVGNSFPGLELQFWAIRGNNQ
jgi:type VI secretion system protein ImpJ